MAKPSTERVPFFWLLRNEVTKLQRRGRWVLVLGIVVLFSAISGWAQHRQHENRVSNEPHVAWQARTTQKLLELERRAGERRIFVGYTGFLRFETARLRYHLDRGIDPEALTGPLAVRTFAMLGSPLLVPLLVALLGADLMSFEHASGTIKLLFTKPVSRVRVFLSKLLALWLFSTLVVLFAAACTWLFSGIPFGFTGWDAPVLAGFRPTADGVDVSAVRIAPLWLETLASYGLLWFAALCVGTIALLFSVLFRSTAASLGALLSILIGGVLLGQLASDFEPAKWFFVTSLTLPQFHAGIPPPVPGMTLPFSVAVLGVWAAAAVVTGAVVVARRDVTG